MAKLSPISPNILGSFGYQIWLFLQNWPTMPKNNQFCMGLYTSIQKYNSICRRPYTGLHKNNHFCSRLCTKHEYCKSSVWFLCLLKVALYLQIWPMPKNNLFCRGPYTRMQKNNSFCRRLYKNVHKNNHFCSRLCTKHEYCKSSDWFSC